MKKVNRVKITHTNDQWSRINEALVQSGTKNVASHITKELVKLNLVIEAIGPVTDCEGCREKLEKIFWLNDSSNAIIENIKEKTGIEDAGAIISRFIISPLLLKCC